MSDDFTLSADQRTKLLTFISRFDQIYGDADFDVKAEWSTPELLALALRVAEILGFEGEHLEQFFCDEFGVAGMTDGALGDMLAIAMSVDVESRVKAAAGGRN
jgi:hypothetical protein